MKSGPPFGILAVAALCAVLAGGFGSLVFMHLVGRHNDSTLLVALFTIWVSSPFLANAGLWFAIVRSSLLAKGPYFSAILMVALGSTVVYGFAALGARMAKPAFPFLVTPLVSWIVVGLATASLISKTRKHGGS
jgi:hypothetical protein